MKTKTRTEIHNVLRPNTPSGYGVSYASTPTKLDRNVRFDEWITWDDVGGKSVPHECHAAKSIKYNQSATLLPLTIGSIMYQGTGSSSVAPTVQQDVDPQTTYPCAAPRYVKTLELSDSEIMDRIDSASTSLASQPLESMMNLPLAIMELRDIPKTLKAMPALMRWLRGPTARAKRLGFGSTVAAIASGYLAYTFGVKPTIQDVKNFLGQVPERVKIGLRSVRYKRGQRVRAGFVIKHKDLAEYSMATTSRSGYQSYQYGSSGTWYRHIPFNDWGANSSSIASRGTTDTKYWPWLANYKVISHEVNGCVFGRVADDFAMDFSAMDDISINGSPLSIGWELIPFSFVVDWFADVGKWLRDANRIAAARNAGFTLQDGIWVSRRNSVVSYEPRLYQSWFQQYDFNPGGSYPVRFQVSTAKAVQMQEVSRSITYDRQVYKLRAVLPRLNLHGLADQGIFQWGTGTALALQGMLR